MLTRERSLVTTSDVQKGMMRKYNRYTKLKTDKHVGHSSMVIVFDRCKDRWMASELYVNDYCDAIHIGMGMIGDEWGVGTLGWSSIISHECLHLAMAKLGLFIESESFDACDYEFDEFVVDWLYPHGSADRRNRHQHNLDAQAFRRNLKKIGVYEQYLHYFRTYGRYRNGGKMGRPL